MTRPIHAALAAALVLAVTACGDSGTEPTGDPLTTVEASVLAGTIATSTQTVTAEGLTVVADEGAAGSGTITVDHQATHPCPLAGTVAVAVDLTVDYDEQAQAFDLSAIGSLTHEGCAFAQDDLTFELDGDPSVTIGLHAAAAGGMPVGDWVSGIEGAFLWSASDGRSGRCFIDLQSVTDFTAGSRTVSGEACGHTVHQTVDWDVVTLREAASLH